MIQPAPVPPRERVHELDALRGFALLGIAVMNVQSFSMVSQAYFNPTAGGYFEGADWWIWLVSHVFFDMKMMNLFSMLFGAGIAMMAERGGDGPGAAARHFRRMAALLAFGLVHAYGVWWGDILVPYALCGFVLYPARNLSPGRLLAGALLVFAAGAAWNLWSGWELLRLPPGQLDEYIDTNWMPSPATAAEETRFLLGSWSEQMEYRWAIQFWIHKTYLFANGEFIRPAAMMLLGMALYKRGVFTGGRSDGFYRRLVFVALFAAVPVILLGVWVNHRANWSAETYMLFGRQFNYWAAPLVSLGYAGALTLAFRRGAFPRVRSLLAMAGRMALTNYLAQTAVFALVFYGYGLGWFGEVNRAGQLGLVAAVWAAQLAWSPLWLRFFRHGPMEWLWRCVTYLRIQPFLR